MEPLTKPFGGGILLSIATAGKAGGSRLIRHMAINRVFMTSRHDATMISSSTIAAFSTTPASAAAFSAPVRLPTAVPGADPATTTPSSPARSQPVPGSRRGTLLDISA